METEQLKAANIESLQRKRTKILYDPGQVLLEIFTVLLWEEI